MSIRDDRRRAALDRMADHVLRSGLGAASLRQLAAAAGTTNRMLLYYFADKDELIRETLRHLYGRLKGLLDQPGAEPLPFDDLLGGFLQTMRAPAMWPYMQLWLELVALAARGEEPFRGVAGQICDEFFEWVARRLRTDREPDRERLAALLLGTADGLVLLDAVGRGDRADLALGAAPGRWPSGARGDVLTE